MVAEKAHPFRFRRKERLKKRDEIGAVFRRGRSFSCAGAKLFMLATTLPHNRLALTFSRKFGNAVERNRARRISREAYRRIARDLPGGHDLVLLVYPGKAGFSQRTEQLRTLFSRAGLLKRMDPL
jgi:ribonuclease P protein component